jgi:hypothetical protein
MVWRDLAITGVAGECQFGAGGSGSNRYDSGMVAMSTQRTYAMLGNQPLWDAAIAVHDALANAGIPHAILSDVAVCLHGYQRNTVDVDWLVRREDLERIRAALENAGMTFEPQTREFLSPTGIPIQFVLAGDREGAGQPVFFPDPDDPKSITTIEALPVLNLAALIQAKLACGKGNLRRTHKDFADVVELIAVHKLDGSFAPRLDKSLRPEFKELLRHAHGGA